MQDEQLLSALAAFWPDIMPWSPRSTGWGTINRTFFVGGVRGTHVLKLYGRDADPAQLRYEHRILTGLGRADLPFSVPAPRPAVSGETLVPVAGAEGVLAALDITPAGAVLPPWGDLARVHPLVLDPRALAGELKLDAGTAQALDALIAEVMEAVASLPPNLPRQITHADYLWPNLLFRDGLVSAVLDFEFATHDLRAFDFVGSLYHFGLLPWRANEGWDLLEAFGSGYGEQIALTRVESEALPLLLRWQRLGGLIYWVGVCRQGLTSRESLLEAVDENLELERWLAAHGRELTERSRTWSGGGVPH